MVWKFVFFQNSYAEILILKVMALGSKAFERWLGHKSRTLMIGSNAQKRGPREHPSSFYDPEEGLDQKPIMLTPWSWTSSIQNCEEYIYSVYKPPDYDILLKQPEQTESVPISFCITFFFQMLPFIFKILLTPLSPSRSLSLSIINCIL